MITTTPTTMTAEEFEVFAALPENEDLLLEFIDGEISEVVSSLTSSEIAIIIAVAIGVYLKTNPLGRLTGSDGGFRVGRNRFIPDVAYTSKARLASFKGLKGYGPIPPDIAIEVISPSDSIRKVTKKISNYMAAGVIVWAVWPEDQQIDVHIPGQETQALTIKDTLDGTAHTNGLLPGFALPLSEVFEQQ
jgi:Uma2 family endonuclease